MEQLFILIFESSEEHITPSPFDYIRLKNLFQPKYAISSNLTLRYRHETSLSKKL